MTAVGLYQFHYEAPTNPISIFISSAIFNKIEISLLLTRKQTLTKTNCHHPLTQAEEIHAEGQASEADEMISPLALFLLQPPLPIRRKEQHLRMAGLLAYGILSLTKGI